MKRSMVKDKGEGWGGKIEGTEIRRRREVKVGRLKGKKQKLKGKGDERVEGDRSK